MSQLRRQSVTPLAERLLKRLKEMARKLIYASPIHELYLKGPHPLRLLGTPKDPWAGSVTAGSHILAGNFFNEGGLLSNPDHAKGEWQDGQIWQAMNLSPKWQQHLHSFCWLRDLNRVVDRKAARDKAIILTRNWLQDFDSWHDLAWSPDIIGQRLIGWMAYAPLILDSDDLIYRSKLLNSLARQARHLYHAGDEMLRGLPRIQAIGGLIIAGLYVPGGESWLDRGTALLKLALAQEILADGGISTRCPEDMNRVLQNLLMIRASYKATAHNIPQTLDDAICRMIPALKNLLHGDGRLALFNGSVEQNAQDIAKTFAFAADLEEKAVGGDGGESGFRRLANGVVAVIVDAGPPADRDISQKCHAGTLSFEMSDGKQRIIVNCGSSRSLALMAETDFDKLSRSTAAHSTLILNDMNSSEIRDDGLIGHGPTRVNSKATSEAGHSLLEASHDGYLSRFGIIHHRTIYLSETGDDLRGEDVLECPKVGTHTPKFDLRFHIHPDLTISRQGAADRLLLRLPTSEYWQFQCSGGMIALEESIYLGDGVRVQNSRQIVVSGKADLKKTVIKWSLRRIEHNI